MQFKLSFLATASFATLAAAAPARRNTSQCNTGPVQCCNSVVKAGSEPAAGLLALLDVVVQDLNIPIGITCSPISDIGIEGDSCTAQPVCCENDSFHGVVAIGCTPINISL